VHFAWEQYQAVITALKNRAHHGLDMLGRSALIPEVVVAALRCSLRPADCHVPLWAKNIIYPHLALPLITTP
jgi:hypothetical protein